MNCWTRVGLRLARTTAPWLLASFGTQAFAQAAPGPPPVTPIVVRDPVLEPDVTRYERVKSTGKQERAQ